MTLAENITAAAVLSALLGAVVAWGAFIALLIHALA